MEMDHSGKQPSKKPHVNMLEKKESHKRCYTWISSDESSESDDEQYRVEIYEEKQGVTEEEKETENWSLSQFWYTDTTTKLLTDLIPKNAVVCCICCPSVYEKLKSDESRTANDKVFLLDIDNAKYNTYKNYIYYNCMFPSHEVKEYQSRFDVVIADAPYISKKCIERLLITIDLLKKLNAKTYLCAATVLEKYLGKKWEKTNHKIEHTNKRGNEYACYQDRGNINIDEIQK